MKNKKIIILVIGVSFMILSCGVNTKKRSKEISKKIDLKPNIVLIMADDLGYGDLSCYGSTQVNTPNLDQLAASGIKFLDFHSNGPVCSPTRAALMTGKYPQRTGVEGVITAASHREVGLNLEEITLAEELNRLGYTSAMFGKWHLGYSREFNPINQGFDKFNGFVSGNIDYHSHVDQEGYLDWWKGTTIDNEVGYTTDLITKYSVDFIKNNNPQKTGRPFFLYVAQEAPHYPIQGRYDKPVRKEGSGELIRKVPKDSIQSIYKEMIEILDESLGDIMQALVKEGLDKNTIIVFCSDNGAEGNLGDNGILRGAKASVYEGGHRVPAIISYPQKIKPGSVCKATVLTMDFLPTFVDFANSNPTGKNIDGISIKDYLLNDKVLPNRDLFWSFKNKSAIRSGKWKLVTSQSGDKKTIELYDLGNDLSEKNNLIINSPAIAEDLLQKLNIWEIEVRAGITPVSK